jgi:Flp pilus assembly protein TadD
VGRKKKDATRTQRPPRRDVQPVVITRDRGLRRVATVAGGVVIGLVVMAGAWLVGRRVNGPHLQAAIASASFVGSNACAKCHADQATQWSRSQHGAAMADASDQNVLGNFSDARFTYAGITSEFFKRDGKFFARTDGPDGKLADFEVKYTFGVSPLQQYLVELPGGRLQALSIAWDSRPKEANGQRWFHLYPKERITHEDERHWSQPSQNWNFMCADCHSTGVRKNYDRAADKFQTHFAEISVGCEACHGPGSRHLQWASGATDGPARSDSTKGLNARLDERKGVAWNVSATTGNASRSHPRTGDREIETCAQCHSRRSQIADGYEAGKRFLDYYRPALLTRPLYHADGQQRDEVYDWGSFLQSKMYARGVTCSDCHNPHSGKLRAEGNATCATCHVPSKYDTPAHHHHEVKSAGATCVGCHMPATTYMVIDPRHDHSLRIPRPDLSVAMATPNACTSCHTQRDARWAASQVSAWYGDKTRLDAHERVAKAFFSEDAGALNGPTALAEVAADTAQSPIARATALAELNPFVDAAAYRALNAALHDPRPLVRLGALQSVERLPIQSRVGLAEPLLSDSLKSIRIDAARILAAVPLQEFSPRAQASFQHAGAEFVEVQRYNADRAEARVNLGSFLAERGNQEAAEVELQSAIRLMPASIPAYVNLADVYRAQGRDADGERVLRGGLASAPQSGVLHYALGLALTRMHRGDSALQEFARAAGLEPRNARFAYVYAIALHSNGKPDAAIALLRAALATHPTDGDIVAALGKFYEQRGDSVQAKRYAAQLRMLSVGR